MSSLMFYFTNLAGLLSDWTVKGHPVIAGWVIIVFGWYLLLRGVELAIKIRNWNLAYTISDKE